MEMSSLQLLGFAALGLIIWGSVLSAIISSATKSGQNIKNQETLISLNQQINHRLKVQNRLLSEQLKQSGMDETRLIEIHRSEKYFENPL